MVRADEMECDMNFRRNWMYLGLIARCDLILEPQTILPFHIRSIAELIPAYTVRCNLVYPLKQLLFVLDENVKIEAMILTQLYRRKQTERVGERERRIFRHSAATCFILNRPLYGRRNLAIITWGTDRYVSVGIQRLGSAWVLFY